jgi:hypothetical protein
LIGRRVPMQRRPVVIRQFHFIEWLTLNFWCLISI